MKVMETEITHRPEGWQGPPEEQHWMSERIMAAFSLWLQTKHPAEDFYPCGSLQGYIKHATTCWTKYNPSFPGMSHLQLPDWIGVICATGLALAQWRTSEHSHQLMRRPDSDQAKHWITLYFTAGEYLKYAMIDLLKVGPHHSVVDLMLLHHNTMKEMLDIGFYEPNLKRFVIASNTPKAWN